MWVELSVKPACGLTQEIAGMMTVLFCMMLISSLATMRAHHFFLVLVVQISISAAVKKRGILDLFLSPCKCKCGIPNREARLLGGEYLRGHELPWAGLIQVKDGRSMPATLINDRFVVTSATNVLGLTPLDIKVTIGQFDRCFPDVSSTNMSVEKIVVHPDFSPADRAHDIALLKFSTPVKIERRVSPICLATPNTKYLGQVATVSAWFETETEQGPASASCRPRKLGLPVLGKAECINSVEDPQVVSNDKGCIGVVGLPSPICRVDSGGPVMFRTRQGVYELVGVLTDRNECNLKPGVALYTYINDHLPWITQNTKDACYCFKT